LNKIYILTGAVHSGKTTKLLEWISNRNDVAGIVSPLLNGRRILVDIKSGESYPLEIQSKSDFSEIIEVGNYRFNKAAFNWGNERVISSIQSNPKWLVIDEFGLLELNQKGFFPAVSFLMDKTQENSAPNSIIIVRDFLVEKFIINCKLDSSQFTIINKEGLSNLH